MEPKIWPNAVWRARFGPRLHPKMTVSQAKAQVGKTVEVRYLDRYGNPRSASGELLEVEYLPMYGSNLVFDFGEIPLDKVVELVEAGFDKAA